MDKKNLIIAVLAGLLVIGSLWGQVGNQQSKALRHELEQAEAQLSTVEAANSQTHDAVLTKTADLQKTLQGKEKQLTRARKELVSLRKGNKGLEAKLSERDATVQKLMDEKKQLVAKVQAADSKNADADQVADLEKQILALQKSLKKKRPQSGRIQSAVIVQLADAQKQVMTLQKELKSKDKQLVQQKSVPGAEQLSDLHKEMNALQAELKKKDEQLAHAQSSAANQVTALKEKMTALQKTSQEKGHQVVNVQEGVTPIQFAFFQAELKTNDKQLARALSSAADLQEELTALHVELEKKNEEVAKKQGSGADQIAGLQKKIAVLQGELKKNEKLLVSLKNDESEQITDLKKKVTVLEGELKEKSAQPGMRKFVRMQSGESRQDDTLQKTVAGLQADLQKKDEQIAGLEKKIAVLQDALQTKDAQSADVQQSNVTEQEISHLQKNMDDLRSELKRKDEQLEKDRSLWSDQVADLKIKLTGLMNELSARDERIAALQTELQESSGQDKTNEAKETEVTTGQDVAKLQDDLAAAKARNLELEQAVQSASQSHQEQAVGSQELATAEAQILGLEKIVEEKNVVIEEISRTLDRVKINMNVLLNKIGDQQDGLQELKEANRGLVKELTVKNEELADLQEQLEALPAQ